LLLKKFFVVTTTSIFAGGAFQHGGSFDAAGWSIEVCAQFTMFF